MKTCRLLKRGLHDATIRYRGLPAVRLDLEKAISDPTTLRQQLELRKSAVTEQDVDHLVELQAKRKSLLKQLEGVQARQNQARKSRITSEEGVALRTQANDLSSQLSTAEDQLRQLAILLPNSSHPTAPTGDYNSCETVQTLGPAPTGADDKYDHVAAATELGWYDQSSSQRISGSRWPVLLREAALLELALTQYAFSIAVANGFSPILLPDVVRTAVSDRCGFQPRDASASQSYYVTTLGEGSEGSRPDLVLAGTAEIPLAGHVSDAIYSAQDLPLKLVALGRAFRAEAGARGKENRGLYRVHQFSKVEFFVVSTPEQSEQLLQELVQLQESILQGLELPLRTLHMSTEELGASAHQKYDIEAWMPGRGSWGEVGICSSVRCESMT